MDVGSTIDLRTDLGMKSFNIAGIYYDYASDEGVVTIHYKNFTKYWFTEGVSGISVFVKDGVPLENVKEKILSINTGGQEILVRTFRFLRDTSVEIFDRTFLISKVL